jgi:hypothetical protein
MSFSDGFSLDYGTGPFTKQSEVTQLSPKQPFGINNADTTGERPSLISDLRGMCDEPEADAIQDGRP